MNNLIKKIQQAFYKDFTAASLKFMIIIWALFIITLALIIDNAWILAGILAYEILP